MPEHRTVVLLPTYAQVVAYRKRQAREGGPGSFRCEVATATSWAESLWELFGDGRAFVTDAYRDIALALALTQAGADETRDARDVRGMRDAKGVRYAGDIQDAGIPAARPAAPGTVALAARLARAASGLAEFERALDATRADGLAALPAADGSAALSQAEIRLLAAVARYRDAAARAGIVEPGEAMALLPHLIAASATPAPVVADRVTFRPFPMPSLAEVRFLESLARVGAISGFEVELAETDILDAVAARAVDVRFAFPSGRYAEPMLLADLAQRACEERDGAETPPAPAARAARVVVAAKDPIAVYESIATACAARGLSCAVRARRPFGQTAFGTAYAAMRQCVTASESVIDDLDDLSDVLLSPFSGFSTAHAQRIDAKLRGGRRTTLGDCLAELRAASVPFARLEELARDPEADVLAGAVEDAVRRLPGATEAWRREQVAALGALREAMAAVRATCAPAGIDDAAFAMSLVDRELARAVVDVSRANAPLADDAPDVLVMTLQAAAALSEGACDVAVATDMTAAAYPAAARADAAVTLLAKVGLAALPPSAPAAPAPRPAAPAPAAAVPHPAAPTPPAPAPRPAPAPAAGALAPATPASAAAPPAPAPAAPVFPNDDALAVQRAALCALLALPTRRLVIERRLLDAEADPTYPAAVVQELIDCFRADPSATDDIDNAYSLPADLQEGMATRGEEALFENAVAAPGSQRVVARVPARPFGTVSEEARARIVLPREIEGGAVVRTPCLSPSQIESYLECPCKWFADRRLRLDELDHGFGPIEMGEFAHHALKSFYRAFREETGVAKVTLALLDEARALMRRTLAEPFDDLVPATELERRALGELKAGIVRFLDYEAAFLPGFAPAHLELDIPFSAHVPYAGHEVVGRVDRVDVDGEGRAVIVDYKSSVGPDYALYGAERDYPRKVQALVYARAVERLLGVRVVGALYVSYGRALGTAGAYDPDVIPEGALPKARHGDCRPRAEAGESFADVLDATEERAASAIDRMLAGDVAPDPLSASSCTWCPVRACPERRL